MPTPLRNLGELLAYAATKPGHDRADREVAGALVAEPASLGLDGVDVRWLGVAGFSLTCDDVTILIDPYVTRRPVSSFLRRERIVADVALVDRHVPPTDAILLGHTHFDHAVDAPAIARRDSCTVYGGASAARLMGLNGMIGQAVEVAPHRVYEIGPFEVTFVPSLHSKLLLGMSVPSAGEITCEHVDGLTGRAYRCGQVWGIHIAVGGHTIYHQGSADLVDDEIRHRDVDVFLCGVAGRQVTPDYVPRILGRLRPETVVVCHHDNFFRPLDGDTGFAFGVDVARFPDEVAAVSRDITTVTLSAPA